MDAYPHLLNMLLWQLMFLVVLRFSNLVFQINRARHDMTVIAFAPLAVGMALDGDLLLRRFGGLSRSFRSFVNLIFRLGGVVSLIDAAGNHMAFIAVTHMAVGMPLDTSTLRLAGRRICDYLDTYLTTGIARLKTQKHTFSCFRLSQGQNLRRSVYKFNALHKYCSFHGAWM